MAFDFMVSFVPSRSSGLPNSRVHHMHIRTPTHPTFHLQQPTNRSIWVTGHNFPSTVVVVVVVRLALIVLLKELWELWCFMLLLLIYSFFYKENVSNW